MIFLAINSSSSNNVYLWSFLVILLIMSGSIVLEIYKDKKNLLFIRCKKGDLSVTEYKKKIRMLRLYSIIGVVIISLLMILLLYLIGIFLLFLVFLTTVVFKKSR